MPTYPIFRVLITLAWLSLANGALAQEKLSLNIPAQPVHEAIKTLAQQAGLQVAARSEDLEGIRSKAIHGIYSPVEALTLLLEGTGLAIDITEANSVTIRRDNSSLTQRTPGDK